MRRPIPVSKISRYAENPVGYLSPRGRTASQQAAIRHGIDAHAAIGRGPSAAMYIICGTLIVIGLAAGYLELTSPGKFADLAGAALGLISRFAVAVATLFGWR